MLTAEEVARGDLLLFLNAAFVCTGQAEFYGSADGQQISAAFLHDYVRTNYRRLYARMLGAGINDFNTAEIVVGLLRSGAETPSDFRDEENALLRAASRRLPPNRFWKLAARLRRESINNRRARALVRDWMDARADMDFQAVKYRRKVAEALRHAHLHPAGEVPRFLFNEHRNPFETDLLERYRQARFSKAAVYELPYTVAQGLAAKHGIDPGVLLSRMAARLTETERLRAHRRGAGDVDVRPEKLRLTDLAAYALSLKEPGEVLGWLPRAAREVLARTGTIRLPGKVAAVLDNSYSSSGSREKRSRPLAVAFAADHLLTAGLGDRYRGFWTSPPEGMIPRATGQTNLTERFLDALDWGAATVLVISDGVENDPPGAFDAVLTEASRLVAELTVLHLNPVFDSAALMVTGLSSRCPVVGLRHAEDLPTVFAFARYVAGTDDLSALEAYLATRAAELIAEEDSHA